MHQDEKKDWINALSDTSAQLDRLREQLGNIKNEDFTGIIGRIQSCQANLAAIKAWLIEIK